MCGLKDKLCMTSGKVILCNIQPIKVSELHGGNEGNPHMTLSYIASTNMTATMLEALTHTKINISSRLFF